MGQEFASGDLWCGMVVGVCTAMHFLTATLLVELLQSEDAVAEGCEVEENLERKSLFQVLK